jgi:hypothetical protein
VNQHQAPGLVLLIEDGQSVTRALEVQNSLVAEYRVRLDRKPKNVKALLSELSEQGFTHFAFLTDSGELDIKPIG